MSVDSCLRCGCCESYGYVLSFVQWLLDNNPKESQVWETAARIMDEVGK